MRMFIKSTLVGLLVLAIVAVLVMLASTAYWPRGLDGQSLAAWVQAVGSLLALAAALSLGWHGRWYRRRQAAASAYIFVRRLVASIESASAAARIGDRGALMQESDVLGEMLRFGRTLRFDLMPYQAASECLSLVVLCAEGHRVTSQIAGNPIIDPYGFRESLERLERRVHDSAAVFARASGVRRIASSAGDNRRRSSHVWPDEDAQETVFR